MYQDEEIKKFYGEWTEKIPYIKFPIDWSVSIIPPYANATVRFYVKKDLTKEQRVSVYLDCYGKLGIYEGPYWEVYPCDDDIFRCGIYDTESLLKAIEKSLDNL